MAKTRTAFTGVIFENQQAPTLAAGTARIRLAPGTSLEDGAKYVANCFKNLASKGNVVEVPVDPDDVSKGTKKVTLTQVDGIFNLR